MKYLNFVSRVLSRPSIAIGLSVLLALTCTGDNKTSQDVEMLFANGPAYVSTTV